MTGLGSRKAGAAPRLVYFSSVPWQSYEQRPHKFIRHFRRHIGGKVLWIQPYPVRLPNRADFQRKRSVLDQGTTPAESVDCLWIPALPVEPVPGGRFVNRFLQGAAWRRITAFAEATDRLIVGVGKPSALALQALHRLDSATSFYDAMDNFPDFYSGLSRLHMARVEAMIATRVDYALASSRAIRERLKVHRSDIELVHNACEVDSIPYRPRAVGNNTVYGYVGSIGHWFDWSLLVALARAAPEGEFRLLGPVFQRARQPLPENVKLLGARAHDESVRLMADFTVGLIPFKLNRLTAGVDPIKYYEYLCAGLPVVSTPFGEMRQRGREDGVFQVVADEHDLAGVLHKAAAHRLSREFVDAFRSRNDWHARFQECSFLLQSHRLEARNGQDRNSRAYR